MRLKLKVWRQDGPDAAGHFDTYTVDDAVPEMSVLELLDNLNNRLVDESTEPVAFESDCREGICGTCGITVDGHPHGRQRNTPACHQRLTEYSDGDTITIEPFRAASFPVVKDLVVDRGAMDRILEAGGYAAVPAGTAPDADATLLGHADAEAALDFAACIGCGACVAACPNGSGNLFVGGKLSHLAALPVPKVERSARARAMTAEAEAHFGPCSLYGECAQVCPAHLPLTAVAAVNKERLRAVFRRN